MPSLPFSPALPVSPLRRALPAALPMLRLMGTPEVCWAGRRNPPWAYAKLPAVLAVLAASGRTPVRRDWLAALLWPDRDAASLRRALYDLRRQLRHGGKGPPLIESSRQTLWLSAGLPTDLDLLLSAWRSCRSAEPDLALAERALALWRGEFAAGLVVPEAEDFDLWLMQTRAQWQQRALQLSMAVAEQRLRDGRADLALDVAQRAVEQLPDADSARAIVWRCLVAAGSRLQAAQDWRRHADLLAAQGLAPSAALAGVAADLGLGATPVPSSAPRDDAALVEALNQALRQGLPGGAGADILLDRTQQRLQGLPSAHASAEQRLMLRRALMLRLMHSPWHLPMSQLAAIAERQLCITASPAERLDLVQPLATWHGWMGRGLRGEVLLRSLGPAGPDDGLPLAARVRHEMTLALCHSCSTGDPERSIQAALRGLKLARDGAVPGCRHAFLMLVANAALNRDAPGDARRAEQALAEALDGEPLLRFDLVNHLQLSAQWQLAHGDTAHALALAEQGERMAQAVPFPLQGLSCGLLLLSAQLLLGEPAAALAERLEALIALARRIGSQGYLMNALFIGTALARRRGDTGAAMARRAEAQAIAGACGVRRIRKVAAPLLQEALADG